MCAAYLCWLANHLGFCSRHCSLRHALHNGNMRVFYVSMYGWALPVMRCLDTSCTRLPSLGSTSS